MVTSTARSSSAQQQLWTLSAVCAEASFVRQHLVRQHLVRQNTCCCLQVSTSLAFRRSAAKPENSYTRCGIFLKVMGFDWDTLRAAAAAADGMQGPLLEAELGVEENDFLAGIESPSASPAAEAAAGVADTAAVRTPGHPESTYSP